MGVRPVLLVEDNAEDETLILRALGAAIANPIDVVRSGEEALEYLSHEGRHAGGDPAVSPALILLDVGLPGLSGLDVLERVRADPRTVLLPVVVLTSSDEEQDRLRSYARGANSFVRKPVNVTEFAKAVSLLGMYWLVTNESP